MGVTEKYEVRTMNDERGAKMARVRFVPAIM